MTDWRAPAWGLSCSPLITDLAGSVRFLVLELLTGKPVFEGETVSEIVAAVLKSEPDFNHLPANLSPRMRELLERALAKNLRRRWQAIGDVRIEIEPRQGIRACLG